MERFRFWPDMPEISLDKATIPIFLYREKSVVFHAKRIKLGVGIIFIERKYYVI
jgi:hypothetical protein